MQLYTKEVSKGGRVKYVEYPPADNVSMELDTSEVVTLLTVLCMCTTQSITRFLPDHSRIHRCVTDCEKAILKLSQGNRGPLDDHLIKVGEAGFNAGVKEICHGLEGGRLES